MSLRFRKIKQCRLGIGQASRGLTDCRIGNRRLDANTSVNPGRGFDILA